MSSTGFCLLLVSPVIWFCWPGWCMPTGLNPKNRLPARLGGVVLVILAGSDPLLDFIPGWNLCAGYSASSHPADLDPGYG